MKISTLATASLALPLSAYALPASVGYGLSIPEMAGGVMQTIGGWIGGWGEKVEKGVEGVVKGMKVEDILMHGINYQSVTHPSHPSYRLRIVSPKLCDTVLQYSGYLDISSTKSLFFWFFESRSSPSTDPVIAWFNGGPGCSSTTGLLFELGSCMVADEGKNVTYNKEAWNEKANVMFLDQPIGVGYSYADPSEKVDNSPAAAEDIWAFLQLFMGNFPQYRKNDFHIAGESYAGTYIPHFGSVIHQNNLALLSSPPTVATDVAPLPILNLKSLMIGNGLTDAALQFASVPEYACDSEYAVYDDPTGPECEGLRSKMKRCESLVNTCYKTGSKFACVPAGLVCWQGFSQFQNLGINLYDTRKKCDRAEDKDGPLCYKQMGWIETYLNDPLIKSQLGVPSTVEFKSCNMQINQNFLFQGDAMHDTKQLLTPLVEDGVRVLIYAGVRDLMCNFIGNEKWMNTLETSYLPEFLNSTAQEFIASDGKVSGHVRSAGGGSGNVAYLSILDAGHMVPQDQPVAALTMVNRWLKNKPLAKGK